ncbi:SCO4225 family membrane protein [Streptomyces sp. NPDC056749]|uniref:SCO4225 family membrane protein n=1 Tax=Streptomyces sp. NPDC056749 TaxID=3345936 RepID=UPI0036C436E6
MAASPRTLSRSVRHNLLNPAALGYLAIVAAVGVWVGLDATLVEHADASLAGVWLFIVTAPTSMLFAALPGSLPFAGIAVGAFVQALALGAAYRWALGRATRRTATAGA